MIAFICTEKVLVCGVGVKLDPMSFYLVIFVPSLHSFTARCVSDCEEGWGFHWLRCQPLFLHAEISQRPAGRILRNGTYPQDPKFGTPISGERNNCQTGPESTFKDADLVNLP